MEKRMPTPRSDKRIIVQRGTRFIGDWIGRTFFYSFDSPDLKRDYPWAERFVMGLPLYPGQRDLKWTEEMEQEFLEDAWNGQDLPPILIAEKDLEINPKTRGYNLNAEAVVDGQQRLNTLERYLRNEITLFGMYFKDLNKSERRHFHKIQMDVETIFSNKKKDIDKIYNMRNFAGVPHEESERIK